MSHLDTVKAIIEPMNAEMVQLITTTPPEQRETIIAQCAKDYQYIAANLITAYANLLVMQQMVAGKSGAEAKDHAWGSIALSIQKRADKELGHE